MKRQSLATAAATPSPVPAATPAGPGGQPTAGANDVVLALVLAGIAIGAIALFLVARSRR